MEGGTSCCGATVELIGSYGRLVKNKAMNVASAAAAITLTATNPSRDAGAEDRAGRRAPREGRPRGVSITIRFLDRRSISLEIRRTESLTNRNHSMHSDVLD